MTGYLIAEDGPLIGHIIHLDDSNEWTLGRDRDSVNRVIEDPQVSRKHAAISLIDNDFVIENLSETNPLTVNGQQIMDPTPLHEGDIVQIGSSYFRFTLISPDEPENFEEEQEEEKPSFEEANEEVSLLSLSNDSDSRWLIKVISGPNTGAEFGMSPGQTYVVGKDPNLCDIFFQDLSVSRQHAKIAITEDGIVIIEDLGSRNGVVVNGNLIEKEQTIHSQDLISLGTTSFLAIDREQTRETLYSPSPTYTPQAEQESDSENQQALQEEIAMRKNWKDMVIPTKHIVIACCLIGIVGVGLFSMLSLFKTQTIAIAHNDQEDEIKHVLKKFPAVEFNYSQGSGKLFLLGHVLTDIQHQEMLYMLRSLPFVTTIEDNVIIDEYVWEDMNALLFKNPNWRSVLVIAPQPGKFILKGYLKSSDQIPALMDYVNNNFPYLDRLENQVVVETTLETEVQSLLIEKGFNNVTFNLSSGELVLAGRVHSDSESKFKDLIDQMKNLSGIKEIKNYVIYAGHSSSRIDLSSKYQVSGTSKYGNENQFVLINGKILSVGDILDGMKITNITPHTVLLDKDGLKYKIDYNL